MTDLAEIGRGVAEPRPLGLAAELGDGSTRALGLADELGDGPPRQLGLADALGHRPPRQLGHADALGRHPPREYDGAPAVTEAASAVIDAPPAVVEPASAVIDAPPAVVEPVPAVIDAPPAVVEPVPAVIEPAPTAPRRGAADEPPPSAGRSSELDLAEEPPPSAHPRPLEPLQAELIAGAGAAVMLVALRFMPWFGVDRAVGGSIPRASVVSSEGAWHALMWMRWVVLVAVVLALVPLVVRPAQRWIGVPKGTHAAVAAVGGLTALLLSYRVLIVLPDPSRVVDQRAGAILGVLAALVITLGGFESIRAQAAWKQAREGRAGSRRGRARDELTRIPS